MVGGERTGGTGAEAHPTPVGRLSTERNGGSLNSGTVARPDRDIQVSGGQTVPVTDTAGNPALLPPGAHCFAAETDAGGAYASSVDHDSYDNAVIVEQGDELGTLTITAVNTFNTPPVPSTAPNPFYPPGSDGGGGSGALSFTGFPAGQWVLIGFALFALGAGLVSVTRRRRIG